MRKEKDFIEQHLKSLADAMHKLGTFQMQNKSAERSQVILSVEDYVHNDSMGVSSHDSSVDSSRLWELQDPKSSRSRVEG